MKLVTLSCLIIYFQPFLITPYSYSSLEFTKLFDFITFNLSLKRPNEVSKAVTSSFVLQRRKQLREDHALPRAMQLKAAKPTPSGDFAKPSIFSALSDVLTSKVYESSGPASFPSSASSSFFLLGLRNGFGKRTRQYS